MFNLDKLIDKILPDIATKRDIRQEQTSQVVEASRKAREHSAATVADAYRLAGEAYARERRN